MSWSLTVDKLAEYVGPSVEEIERIARDNISAVEDAYAAVALAKARGLASVVVSGGRTPMPGSVDEIVDISLRGTVVAQNLRSAVADAIRKGPDEESPVLIERCPSCQRLEGMPTAPCRDCPDYVG